MMTNGMLIHVRANPLVGTGRLLRSLTLARQWNAEGGKVVFVTGPLPAILLRQIAISGCEIENAEGPVGEPEFSGRLCELARQHACSWIVTDDTSGDLIRNLGENRLAGQRLLVLGNVDLAEFRNVDFATGDEPAYALIRNHLGKYPPPRPAKRRPKRCLVDLSRLNGAASARLIKEICRAFGDSTVIFELVTPFAGSAADQLYRQQVKIRDRLFWHRNADRVFASLFSFDLTVMTDAANFFETAFCGMPGFYLSRSGSGSPDLPATVTTRNWLLDANEPDSAEQVARAIREMLGRPATLARHAAEMCRLTDNHGAVRLCQALKLDRQEQTGQSRSA